MEWILSNLGREPRTGDCYQYGIPWSSRLSDQRRWWNREGSACEAVLELASRCLATAFLSRGNCRHADLSVDHSPVPTDRRQRLRTSSTKYRLCMCCSVAATQHGQQRSDEQVPTRDPNAARSSRPEEHAVGKRGQDR